MINSEKLTGLIAVRGGSKRVPNKNIRPFAETNLLEIKINQLSRLEKIDEVVVTSDCDQMLKLADRLGATPMKRDPYYASDTVPMGDVYVHLASTLDTKHIIWTPVTSPLVKDETISKCISLYSHAVSEGKYDSVVTVNYIKEYLWLKNNAINYDPKNHPRSQDLPEIYALNFAVNILSKDIMIKNKNILGDNFLSHNINEVESIDIDTEFDFKIAEFLYKSVQRESE